MSSDNCAVGPNGELLDKSEITWIHDPDDNRPMPLVTISLIDQHQLSVTTLDSFVTQVPLAVHRSTCTSCPSTKVTNPNNVMAQKHKPSDSAAEAERYYHSIMSVLEDQDEGLASSFL